MKSFKITLDRIEEGIAMLLVRDDETVQINTLSFCYLFAKKEISWILLLRRMFKRQRCEGESIRAA